MCERVLRVVWIAPEIGERLNWLSELGAMNEIPGVQVVEVCGPEVSRGSINRGLCRTAEVVIWSGHGIFDERRGEVALAIPRGRPVRAQWLATQALAAAPLAFIGAACGTVDRDDSLESFISAFSDAGINAVGFPSEVRDDFAATYIVEFVRALGAKRDVGRAHKVALSEASNESLEMAKHVFLKSAISNGYRDVVDQIKDLDDRLSRVELLQESMARKMGVTV